MVDTERPLTIAAVAMRAEHSPIQNIEQICETVRSASRDGADLVVLPECAVQGYPLGLGLPDLAEYEYQAAQAQPVPGPATEAVRRVLKGTGTIVALGLTECPSIAAGEAGMLFNSVALFNADGVIAKYRKVHTGGVEKCLWNRGKDWVAVDTQVGRIGLFICYDLVFPEAARALALKGAELLLLSTAWGRSAEKTFANGYDLFTRARALENQVFLVSSNLVDGPGDGFHGHSRIVDPSGTILSESQGPGIAIATISLRKDLLALRSRSWFGQVFLRDRAPDTYHP